MPTLKAEEETLCAHVCCVYNIYFVSIKFILLNKLFKVRQLLFRTEPSTLQKCLLSTFPALALTVSDQCSLLKRKLTNDKLPSVCWQPDN